ncbi:bifunctional diaminohydroxyphosphoribosylaminopyrimidine deaminase/5-amino-6-(5-phosphoribosylamino)uracil reductase RibD [Alicyclobacillus dauci]|uniref:Riboflavin biosynthesis protein RibD n=1 Tax=Alicyclobacillus dauci TaxID=1475485 RepID=A0ABY6Z4T7_9BACL|nr:bifunctional diaminohydroxyphosphoribosylaminopyrimidine deaminase/5-amino-6-(5-phosphoribosylamino)uracil reductase RibD [Alicyclobacillus dauci]WAH37879.1 bifunctional diaminohydroxyphosphoribosylaminopyrimidine deaminase/5-amino-6-(5-phosphoribosylamino)uracil reductase RibD [Alicyclobacillus dauci]
MGIDEWFMQMALDIARVSVGQTSPNPNVGAVVVKDGRVVGQGAHLYAGGPHAEVHALRMAGEGAQGATIYVTLEPCNHHGRTPPCTEAIIAAGIRRVVIASVDHDPRTAHGGISRLQDAGLDVTVGILEEQANRMNRVFFHRIDTGRPLVVYKAATTLSGHVAANSGHSRYVTGDAARADVQRMRLEHPSIAVGVQTVLADDPRLTVRGEDGAASERQPVRVVFDSVLRTPTNAAMFREPGQTLILSTAEGVASRPHEADKLRATAGVEVVAITATDGRINLVEAMQFLGARGFNSMLLEGGPTLAASFFAERLVDEVRMYVAPKLLANGLPALQGVETSDMGQAIRLSNAVWQQIGEDLRLDATVLYTDEAVFRGSR